MKKIYFTMLIFVLAISTIFASGQSEKVDNNEVSNKPLSVMIWDTNQEPGITKMIEEFTQRTGIKAEVQVVNWNNYWTLLAAGAEGGSLPDIFWMHSKASEKYMSNGLLLNLSDKINQSDEINLDNYPSEIVKLYTYENNSYAIPKDIDTIALWYNKTLFDEAGVEYPNENWSWDDLYINAKKLTKADGSVYGYANKNSEGQGGWYNMVYSNNGYIISDDKKKSGLDNPNTIEALQTMQKLIDEKIMPPQEMMAENNVDVLFQSGKVAMAPFGSWMLSSFKSNEYIKNNCDVALLPKNAKTNRRVSIFNGLGWAISANSKRADDSWKLIEFFGSKEGQLLQAELGITMSAYNNTSANWKSSAPYFNLDSYLKMQNDMVMYPYSKSSVKWELAVNDSMLEAWSGKITITEASKKAAKLMNEIISEE